MIEDIVAQLLLVMPPYYMAGARSGCPTNDSQVAETDIPQDVSLLWCVH